jgi:cytochrome c oxidase subunit I
VMSSSGAAVLAAAYLLPLGYFAWSLYYGSPAGNHPWGATGLEWTTSSPPPPKNFDRQPRIDRSPYDYHAAGQSAGVDPPEAQNAREVR